MRNPSAASWACLAAPSLSVSVPLFPSNVLVAERHTAVPMNETLGAS